jgi:2-octaprenyl-6-methoxyphenol hydroxylase
MATPTQFDLAIAGAGPVGLALAAMLTKNLGAGKRIALIDAKSPEAAARDPRYIALSYGSRQLLEQIQAWPSASTPITQIHVSRRGSFGRTLIDNREYDLPALGYVCRYGDLVQALDHALAHSGVAMLRPSAVLSVDEQAADVTLNLEAGNSICADFMVQAEGGVYGSQSEKQLRRDYHQSAIVATVVSSAAIAGRAFERFTSEGPLALLPQGDAYALVWCARPLSITRLLDLSDAEFLEALQQAFGQRVGMFTQVSARNSYQLGLNANPAITARTVAIGNAAQTLHPVAGQGFNLGLRDAHTLATLLAKDFTPAALSLYHTKRQRDRSATIHLTDVMARTFADGADGSLLQTTLGFALGCIDIIAPAKRLLAEQMMFGSR